MIYEQQHDEEQFSLFNHPEQLLLLRQHLIILLQKSELPKNDRLYMHQLQDVNDPELKQEETINDLLQKIQQNEQQLTEISSQMHTLAEITVKMIDYIGEMHQKHIDSIMKHEDQIQNLKAQLQIATQKNHLIEGDVQLFRERLMVAQAEMEDIERNEQLESDKVRDFQNEKKIQLLELQLQRFSQQLNVCKLQYTHKQPQVGSLDRIMCSNMSEKLIKIKRMPSVIMSNPFIHSQEMTELQNKIKILQRQNETLRYEIQSLRENNYHYQLEQLQFKQYQHQQHPYQEEYKRQQSADGGNDYPYSIQKVTSTSFLKSAARQQTQHLTNNMVSHKSIEKFHTLSSEWSTKSFENHLYIFNMDSHHNNLIYLNNEDEEKQHYHKGCIPETKETENSLPDSQLNSSNKFLIKAKCYCEIAVNTETSNLPNKAVQILYNLTIQPQKQQPQDLPQKTVIQKLVNATFKNLQVLKKRAVDYRISKGLHQRSRGI